LLYVNREYSRPEPQPAHDAKRLRDAVERLAGGGEDAENLDIKALAGRAPWLRLRVGEWRVIYRPIDPGRARPSLASGAERIS
jgi:mRNA-degrading endonuclease RelE of RelBE toxin-antitoxin system